MADIAQWRRMIQPTRSRTPALEPDILDDAATPVTPKRGLKPKFSSYFTQLAGVPEIDLPFGSSIDDLMPPQLPIWPEDEPYPQPNAEGLIDSIMCRLMSDPYGMLDPRFNGMILQIFESYRAALDEKTLLQAQLDDLTRGRRSMVHSLQQAQKQWAGERQAYKAEIKRLEVLIANGAGGLAEVTLARQSSQLTQHENIRRSQQIDASLQSVFDSLERANRLHEKAWSSQRAVFRPQPVSPSANMKRLSQQLMAYDGVDDCKDDSLVETIPRPSSSVRGHVRFNQPQQLSSETHLQPDSRCRSVSEPKTSLSVETMSTFSCLGDLLPDEASGTASEQLSTPSKDTKKSTKATAGLHKQPSLIAKASGLLHRLMPQSHSTDTRHFSFEAGEEALTLVPAGILGKSASLPSLTEQPQRAVMPMLSPVAQSTTTSTTMSDTKRASRIPTPIHTGKSMARPRKERDTSSSDLLWPLCGQPIEELQGAPSNLPESCPGGMSPSFFSSNVPLDGVGTKELLRSVRGNAFANAAFATRHNSNLKRSYESSQVKRCMQLYGPQLDHLASSMNESTKENVPPLDLDREYEVERS
ncbi:hypothetical protein LTR78_002772 [Recurvomyces mirabilis]|uniref:Uncharacterized protein n=1 Tax=Recurvomyces mirabilis TaxID=574656 RepID=A0AAE0WTC0_9PEZI|nr:hypothetical protein LTR78_002772 [Recurvomyces mirabilis]KAK5159494.1 hypothetical protein LTS14_002636 [Recurvomyces mirabilis]